MTLAEFKTIYWWEWSHRFFGRVIGIAFLLPLMVFYARGWLRRADLWPLLAIFALGALQAVIGWVMVQSGLSARVDVAPQRLALHFGLAMVIYGAVIFYMLRFDRRFARRFAPAPVTLALAALVFVQLILGAMVAGAKAGMIHNHWLWPHRRRSIDCARQSGILAGGASGERHRVMERRAAFPPSRPRQPEVPALRPRPDAAADFGAFDADFQRFSAPRSPPSAGGDCLLDARPLAIDRIAAEAIKSDMGSSVVVVFSMNQTPYQLLLPSFLSLGGSPRLFQRR